jgi:hypothetical protein
MAEVKGVVVNAMLAFLNETYSREAVDKAVTVLSPEDASLLRRRFLASSEYPYDTMVALRRLMRSLTKRPGDAEAVGAYIATYVFTGPYKPLLAKSPEEMVQKISSIKDFFYRDARAIEGRMTGPSSCVVTYLYEPGVRPTRAVCLSNIGFWGRVLELSRGQKVTSTHATCVCEGADRCEFSFSWV